MPTATAAKAPPNLGAKARRLWRDVTKVYALRADELSVLEDACREVDLIEAIRTEMVGKPLEVRGSMGQPVASPLMQELRQHVAVKARLLAALKLPDESGETSRSASARDAAHARWSRGA